VGGLYGLLIGNVFFGESMFHKETDASKAAFTALAKLCVDYGVEVIDCQVYNPHLESLGATLISRQDFEKALRDAIKQPMASILDNPHCLTAHHPQGA
jgi:leucyl/phenylalanyl-tRNA--protein transferase